MPQQNNTGLSGKYSAISSRGASRCLVKLFLLLWPAITGVFFFFFFNTSVIGICVGPPEQQGKIKCENKVKVHQIFIVTEEKTKKKLMREVGNGLKAKLL